MKTWVKIYTEINRDPDIGTLTWAQRGIWTALIALAGEIDHRDELEEETGQLDTLERVAWSIRCDISELAEAVKEFEARGMIEIDGSDMLYLPNYRKRQSRPPSSRPSAVAERVKRHRAKEADECNDVTGSFHRGVTPSDTDTDTDQKQIREDTDTEAEADQNRGNGLAAACLRALHRLGIKEPKASQLVENAKADGFLPNLAPYMRDWLDVYLLQDGVTNPQGLAITQVEQRVPPPARAGPTMKF